MSLKQSNTMRCVFLLLLGTVLPENTDYCFGGVILRHKTQKKKKKKKTIQDYMSERRLAQVNKISNDQILSRSKHEAALKKN